MAAGRIPSKLGLKRALAPVREAGDMSEFSVETLVHIPGAFRYFSETLRQCATLIVGSTLLFMGMMMVIGGECSLFFIFLARPLGATAFTGFFNGPCGIREVFPYMFGYVFAAKIGCGLVAEIGAMRISKELDALESVGMNPISYVLATRLVAIWFCVPLIYVASILSGVFAGGLVGVLQFGDLSFAQYYDNYWTSQARVDNLFSLGKIFAMATAVAFVGMYYGYKASGGPAGVGNAVARSMILNLILVHVIGAVGTAIFFAVEPGFPQGG